MQILVLVATIESSGICSFFLGGVDAFKAVAGKVSLKLANMQGLVSP